MCGLPGYGPRRDLIDFRPDNTVTSAGAWISRYG